MKITNELISKLKDGGELTYEGETYDCFEYGGSGWDSWQYLKSKTTDKMIKFEYRLHKVGEDEYFGIEDIRKVVWWEDYEKGTIIDMWNWIL